MAGYIGNKAVNLSTSGADIGGTANLDAVDIDGAVNMATTALVTGVLTANGGAVFNEGSADVDFRVESNGNANMFFVDGGNDAVGIGTAAPDKAIHVKTAVNNTAVVRIESTATDSYPTLSLKNDAREYQLTAHGPLGDVFTIYDGTAGSHRFVIDSTGAVTMPAQPAFLAQPASNQNNIGSDQTVVFGTERFDQNADFASNTFTAPVTGKYQFNASLRINNWDVSANYYQMRILTSNRPYITTWDAALHASTDHDYITLTISALADMDANDTSLVQINQNGGAAQADLHAESCFSGYLAC